MQFELHHRPAYAMALVHLAQGEEVVAEAGAMISMDTHINVQTSAAKPGQGLVAGLFAGLKRMVAGESFFQNRFVAHNGPGVVAFAPTHVGDIVVHELAYTGLLMQSHAFLCSANTVNVDAKWTGGRSFFAGEGLVMLKVTGTGPVAFNAFGGIKEIAVQDDLVVETGHIVAFEDTLQYSIRRFGGGWKSFIFGGGGFVCSFSGTGKVWLQTRNPVAYGEAIGKKLPMREG